MPVRLVPALLAFSLAGCTAGPDAALLELSGVDLSPDPVLPTVFVATVETNAPARVHLEYGPDADLGFETPATEESTVHEVRMVGLPAGETWSWRLVAEAEGLEEATEIDTVEVGPKHSAVPDVEVLENDGLAWGDYTVASFGRADPGNPSGVFVLDDEGRPVWFRVDKSGRFVPYAARTPDGGSVIWLASSESPDVVSAVTITSFDGRSEEVVELPRAHHSLAQVWAHGVRFAFIQTVTREVDGEQVAGDQVVEYADDGSQRIVWNAFDQIPVVENEGWDMRNAAGEADWTHANGIDYDAESDAYYLSLYHDEMVVKIDRQSGETAWTLGGTASDFSFPDDRGFGRQHAPEMSGDILYLFDNGNGTATRAVGYRLDEGQHTAWRAWEWETPEGSRVGVLGDVDAPERGQVQTAWGDLGQIGVIDVDGTIHRRFDAEPGAIVARADRFESFYP